MTSNSEDEGSFHFGCEVFTPRMEVDSVGSSSCCSQEHFDKDQDYPISPKFSEEIPDLCLQKILEFVPDLRDRVTSVELVCKRWRAVSKRTRVGGRRLNMQFAEESSFMCVQFNDVQPYDPLDAFSTYGQFRVLFPTLQSMATASSRIDFQQNGARLPRKTVAFFDQLFSRCGKNIISLHLGGRTALEEAAGYLSIYIAVITGQFLQMLHGGCPNLTSLYLRHAQVHDVGLIWSGIGVGTVGSGLEELCMHDTCFSLPDAEEVELEILEVPERLKRVCISENAVNNVNLFLDSLVAGNRVLDSCYLQLGPRDFEDPHSTAQYRELLNRSRRAELSVRMIRIQEPHMHTALTDFFDCTTVVSFDIYINGDTLRNSGLTQLFTGMGKMINLEKLRISGYSNMLSCTSLRSLILQGIQPLEKLKSLRLIKCISKVHVSGWADCMAGLRNLKSFHLQMASTFNDAHLFSFIRNNPDLEYVSLTNCRQLTYRSVFCILKNCRRLKGLRALHVGFIPKVIYSVSTSQRASPELNFVHIGLVKQEPEFKQRKELSEKFPKVEHDGKILKLSQDGFTPEDFDSRDYCPSCAQMM